MKKYFYLLLSACCLSVLSAPVRSNVGASGCVCSSSDKGGVPVLRIIPTTTSVHYSPFNTEEIFSSTEDFKVVAKMRIVPNSTIGSWGTMLGTTGSNNNNGINMRQINSADGFMIYFSGINTYGTDTHRIDANEWVEVEISFDGIYFNGICDINSKYISPESYTSTGKLYIGEGPRGYGATCATDWQYVQIWRNGILTREYVPHISGCFYDTVTGTMLLCNRLSTTRVQYLEEESTYAK